MKLTPLPVFPFFAAAFVLNLLIWSGAVFMIARENYALAVIWIALANTIMTTLNMLARRKIREWESEQNDQ